mgnify:CR=1 FL=1
MGLTLGRRPHFFIIGNGIFSRYEAVERNFSKGVSERVSTMTVNEKMKLVIDLAERALEKKQGGGGKY